MANRPISKDAPIYRPIQRTGVITRPPWRTSLTKNGVRYRFYISTALLAHGLQPVFQFIELAVVGNRTERVLLFRQSRDAAG
jgi:hypothetical protein